MLTPYIAQVLLKTSLYSAVIVYAVIGLLAAIIAWFLPVETLGLQLNQSGIVYIRTVMPCLFTGPKMFWAGPNFLCQTKNLFTYCGSHKHFVPDKKMICIQ